MDENSIVLGEIGSIRGPYNNNWCILKLITNDGVITATGILPDQIKENDTVSLTGKWKHDQKWGKQFNFSNIRLETPKGEKAILKYMSKKFKWIGEKTARKIIDKYGDDAIEKLGDENSLSLISGITPERAKIIATQYKIIKNRQDWDILYYSWGISARQREEILNRYPNEEVAIQKIKEKPYRLTKIHGIGFLTADKIAITNGISKTAPERISSGVFHTMTTAEQSGHCYLEKKQIIKDTRKLLGIEKVKDGLIEKAIENNIKFGEIINLNGKIYTSEMFRVEKNVSDILTSVPVEPIFKAYSETPEVNTLDNDQRKAFYRVVENNVSVITGGPGVGKTHMIDTICKSFFIKRILLAAPTGKAAKRMASATGLEAKTIHRLLEYTPFDQEKPFKRNKENPIECQILIIDEFSMIDIRLLRHLLNAINFYKTKLVIVGDKNQLPSIGPGNCLNDIIASGKFPVTHLTQLHRQAKGSLIHVNAQRINNGEKITFDIPKTETGEDGVRDFFIIPEEDKTRIRELIQKTILRIQAKYGFPKDQIQVLCPQKIGEIGTKAINEDLRNMIYNPGGETIPKSKFRIGDKVIQQKNDYKLEVFNGDIGIIENFSSESFSIRFDINEPRTSDFLVKDYPRDEWSLELAYALTIHKSQGSEFPAVIIPIHDTNYIMLKRNLFYTAITRGKQLVVVIGSQKAIDRAIRTLDSKKRNTSLSERIFICQNQKI